MQRERGGRGREEGRADDENVRMWGGGGAEKKGGWVRLLKRQRGDGAESEGAVCVCVCVCVCTNARSSCYGLAH